MASAPGKEKNPLYDETKQEPGLFFWAICPVCQHCIAGAPAWERSSLTMCPVSPTWCILSPVSLSHTCVSLSALCSDSCRACGKTSLAHSLSPFSGANPCASASVISSKSVPAWAGSGYSEQWVNAFQLQCIIFQEKIKGRGGKLETRVMRKPLLRL